jgi:hypothetical protein
MMRAKWIGGLLAVAVLLVGAGMVSAGVIREDIVFEGRDVVVLLPESYDEGNDLIPLILHLHGAIPLANAREVEMENSGYGDLPSKYRVMVVAPQAEFNQTLGVYAWNSFALPLLANG